MSFITNIEAAVASLLGFDTYEDPLDVAKPKSDGAPLLIMLGDSITQNAANPEIMGFQVMLNQDYVRKADVINRGCSGWTTK
jgi:hypothetical protein